MTIDSIDRSILQVLTHDGRVTYQMLGEACGLSPNATAARVRRLTSTGVIAGFGATINRRALGQELEAIVDVHLTVGVNPSTFEGSIATRPEVVSAYHLTGSADYQLHIAIDGPSDLDAFIRFLKSECGVATTDSRIVLGSAHLDPGRIYR